MEIIPKMYLENEKLHLFAKLRIIILALLNPTRVFVSQIQ